LLIRGANINLQDRWGNTPLMLAVSNQNREAIHSLLRNGSDLSIKNKYGFTVMDKAANIPSILEFIRNYD
jgi:ankyrin repeat protein